MIGEQQQRCECVWLYHDGQACPEPAAEFAGIHTSPPLCTQCLHVCCGEEDDELEAPR